MGRRSARELVFKYLFEKDMNKSVGFDREHYVKRDETKELNESQHKYILDTVEGVFSNLEEIDLFLKDNMETWNLERVGNVERALLRFAVYELKYTEMGTEIVVNEAVELAKKYGEEKSGEFINGVLAIMVKNIRP